LAGGMTNGYPGHIENRITTCIVKLMWISTVIGGSKHGQRSFPIKIKLAVVQSVIGALNA